jgi:CubicO group peptidase (beta-lactamase class C family)
MRLNKATIALAGIAILLIYSCIPRVVRRTPKFGTELPKSNTLSEIKKNQIRTFIKDTASRMQIVMIVQNGEVIFEEGNTKKLINCHSARKSIMSLLFGIAQDKGLLRLDESLEELGIDESKTPLTKQEKTATIRDLLMARSGVYLQAEGEVDYAKNNRPKREQYQPGSFFFYNNFDFNTLGSILEQKTGTTIGKFMEEHLAKPLEMQDFSSSNIVYNSPWPIPNKSNSDYPVYWIYLSARDFAKIGILITQDGKWNNKQVVSESWINKSLGDYTEFTTEQRERNYPYDAFAYSWWIDKNYNTIWADGYGGQFLCIDRKNKLVVLQRNFTGNSLISSGLFLMNKNRDNNPKRDLMHVYNLILN